MQVILTDDVVGLGDIGDTVAVKPGYARNFLIPRGFAIESKAKNARFVEHKRRQIDAKKAAMKTDAEKRAEDLRNTSLKTELRVGSGGKVFGSLSARDIKKLLDEAGFVVDRRRVLLPEPIKKIGTHLVSVKLHADVITQVKLDVVALEATAKQEKQETEAAKAQIEAAAEEIAEQAQEEQQEEVAEESAE